MRLGFGGIPAMLIDFFDVACAKHCTWQAFGLERLP
jgi:hypothetical protein